MQVLSGRYEALEEPLVFSVSGERDQPAILTIPLEAEPDGAVSKADDDGAGNPGCLGSPSQIPTVQAEYRGSTWRFERDRVCVDLTIALSILTRTRRGRYSLIPVNHRCRWERPWRDLLADREIVAEPALWNGHVRVGPIRCHVQGWQRRGGDLAIRLFAVGPLSLKLYECREVGLGASMV
ncbi:hypothetical protein [Heliomicrobium gestii]|nr:hypothetical protein [Heliomicrobium gestii]MBM7866382.1 hypothetical protein [Heliomicrobium gestii]